MASHTASDWKRDVDCLIVGGGISGAACFYELCKNLPSNEIVLCEARNRFGGRSCTEEVNIADGVYSVDTGGQWLGACHCKMLSFCLELNLELEEQELPFIQEGLDEALVEIAYCELRELSPDAKLQVRFFCSFLKESYHKLVTKSSLNEKIMLDQSTVYEVLIDKCSLDEAIDEICFFVQTVLATDPRECSFLFFLHYVFVWGGGVNGMHLLGDGPDGLQALKVKGGTEQISRKLICKGENDCPSSNIMLGCKVVSIDSISDNQGRVIVTTADGVIIHSKHVVLTMSPTLFSKTVMFSPPLSKERTSLYNSMNMGSAIKIIVVFDSPFWEENLHNSCTNKFSISEIGIVSNIFVGKVGPFPALICLITGNLAKKYHYQYKTSTDRKYLVLAQLKRMYCKYTDPIAYIEKDWIADEHSAGCFAATVNASKDGIFATHEHLLREAIVSEKIFLCGTEASTHFYGYLEGGALSGLDAAKQVQLSMSHNPD